eukprot:908024-Amphidinium_carterae.1
MVTATMMTASTMKDILLRSSSWTTKSGTCRHTVVTGLAGAVGRVGKAGGAAFWCALTHQLALAQGFQRTQRGRPQETMVPTTANGHVTVDMR